MSICYRDYKSNRYTYDSDDHVLRGSFTIEEANTFIDRMRDIAREFGDVTVADVKDLVGIFGTYSDTYYGWWIADIDDIKMHADEGNLEKINYITFPQPHSRKHSMRTDIPTDNPTPDTKPTTEKEPLCITIHINDLDDPDAVLADVFKHIYTIKDRMVNVTIM